MNKRFFIVGEEWLYYKVYLGVNTSDLILLNIIQPLVKELIEEKIINEWFFIRYYDPNYHIRIRFHLVKNDYTYNVIKKMAERLECMVFSNQIHKIQIDTYERELERYGSDTINCVERLFYFNSELILEILKNTSDNSMDRWLIGIGCIDYFLDIYGLSIEEKKNLLEELYMSFSLEFDTSKKIKKVLSEKYRKNKMYIKKIILSDLIIDINDLFKNETIDCISIIKSSQFDMSESILKSIIHMHFNRLFNSNQRLNEWIVYYMMFQYYRSKIAQLKYA